MIRAYRQDGGALHLGDMALAEAVWLDLIAPDPAEIAALADLGVAVPSLAEMEEIEISNRLYRADGADYLTVVLPGLSGEHGATQGPVCFVLAPGRLVSVRHHTPRPFDTYPARAGASTTGCGDAERVFLGLIEEIIARIADLMEGAGRSLDATTRSVYDAQAPKRAGVLEGALASVGRDGELLGRLQLSLLTLERALGHYRQTRPAEPASAPLIEVVDGQLRDLHALEVHAEFLSGRVSLATDATLGMINLAQNATVRIVSVVAALFLPPTLVASVYGMNFRVMPELQSDWGYPLALGLMLVSALVTYLYFRWRGWL